MIWIDGDDQLSGFWIDRYEFPNQKGQRPLSGLSLEKAKESCASVDKDVCTASQWRRACLGAQNQNTYGYGSEFQKGWCAQMPNREATHTSLLYESIIFAPSGSFENCRTEDGVMDMIGNVEEWVLDDWMGIGGMLEGGANYTHIAYANCKGNYSRMPDYRLQATQQVFSAGVRCCRNINPLTIADIGLDRRNRLSDTMVLPQKYGSTEVQLSEGTWIDQYEYPNIVGEKPLVGVTWQEAQNLCQSHDKRLCTVDEWERACTGRSGAQYSYGNWYVKGLCGIESLSATPIGFFESCHNDLNVHDMIGGVWEWTDTKFQADVLGKDIREIRGGSWMVEPQKGLCRPWDGYPATKAEGRYEDLGFRCCRGEIESRSEVQWGSIVTCPTDMVGIGNFCIDKMEFPNKRNQLPEKAETFERAQRLCQSQGKKVCTDIQWSMACEGPSHRGYPYGNSYISNKCAIDDSGDVGKIAVSGAFSECATPEGVLDLSGNLWEWVENSDSDGQIRGGGSQLSAGLGRCRSRSLVQQSSQAGVRCCLEPNIILPTLKE